MLTSYNKQEVAVRRRRSLRRSRNGRLLRRRGRHSSSNDLSSSSSSSSILAATGSGRGSSQLEGDKKFLPHQEERGEQQENDEEKLAAATTTTKSVTTRTTTMTTISANPCSSMATVSAATTTTASTTLMTSTIQRFLAGRRRQRHPAQPSLSLLFFAARRARSLFIFGAAGAGQRLSPEQQQQQQQAAGEEARQQNVPAYQHTTTGRDTPETENKTATTGTGSSSSLTDININNDTTTKVTITTTAKKNPSTRTAPPAAATATIPSTVVVVAPEQESYADDDSDVPSSIAIVKSSLPEKHQQNNKQTTILSIANSKKIDGMAVLLQSRRVDAEARNDDTSTRTTNPDSSLQRQEPAGHHERSSNHHDDTITTTTRMKPNDSRNRRGGLRSKKKNNKTSSNKFVQKWIHMRIVKKNQTMGETTKRRGTTSASQSRVKEDKNGPPKNKHLPVNKSCSSSVLQKQPVLLDTVRVPSSSSPKNGDSSKIKETKGRGEAIPALGGVMTTVADTRTRYDHNTSTAVLSDQSKTVNNMVGKNGSVVKAILHSGEQQEHYPLYKGSKTSTKENSIREKKQTSATKETTYLPPRTDMRIEEEGENSSALSLNKQRDEPVSMRVLPSHAHGSPCSGDIRSPTPLKKNEQQGRGVDDKKGVLRFFRRPRSASQPASSSLLKNAETRQESGRPLVKERKENFPDSPGYNTKIGAPHAVTTTIAVPTDRLIFPSPSEFIEGAKVTRVEPACPPVFIVDLVPPQICDLILKLTDEHILQSSSRPDQPTPWRKLYTYTTMDIPCREVCFLQDITDQLVETMVKIIEKVYGHPVVPKGADLRPRTWKEPHLLRYQKLEGLPAHTGTDMHWDGSHVTWQLMLSDQSEYEGGGTHFSCLKRTVKLKKGHALIHPGSMYHKGVDITSGVRTLLVCFMDWFRRPYYMEEGEGAGASRISSACDDTEWTNQIEAWEKRIINL